MAVVWGVRALWLCQRRKRLRRRLVCLLLVGTKKKKWSWVIGAFNPPRSQKKMAQNGSGIALGYVNHMCKFFFSGIKNNMMFLSYHKLILFAVCVTSTEPFPHKENWIFFLSNKLFFPTWENNLVLCYSVNPYGLRP